MRSLAPTGLVLLLAACGGASAGQQADSTAQSCSPVASPATEVAATQLGGAFTVRLVATSGAKRGATTEGRLDLVAPDSAYRHPEMVDGMKDTTTTLPWHGASEIDFAAVGAVVPGNAGSTDPASPGALVIERPGRVMVRLGSEANRRGAHRFDGAFTVLQIQQVSEDGFAGTWRSGLGTNEAGGHFCARRMS
jgi:hypothetical protein